ncbi:hypothetical protein MACH10_31240 [Thalassospira tepidiphila]|uniref:polysaccharide deacetylase family protein n=1 Tax=Thalassospira tepidiphila TaxID=393657 RepID=UPI002925B3D9|nr:hypothetical protein MACH10_31240 [Thalassospira tepidiphila]
MTDNFDLLLARIKGRIFPGTYKKKLIEWARRVHLKSPTLLISFDCDTSRDAKASLHVQRYLHQHGIIASFAVPGELLEANWSDYKKLLEIGAKFVNHGYRRHADVDDKTGKPYSTFTYRDVEDDVWKNDILLGHRLLTKLTGQEPQVFRTPHFGEFNRPSQLEKLYQYLSTLGYVVSSSTTSIFGEINGGAYSVSHGLVELPLNGCLSKPTQLIDSWGFLSAPDALGREKLIYELRKYVQLFEQNVPVLLNLYFDPADIVDEKEVLDVLAQLSIGHCVDLDDQEVLSLAQRVPWRR